MPSQLNYSSFTQYFLCSFSSPSCGQLARETAYCGTACSQTGHYSPQPSTEWVCVWVGVCERAGRCAPRSWKCPKISQQHYCHLHNWAFLFLKRFDFFFSSLSFLFSPSSPLFTHSASSFISSILHCTCEHQRQTVTTARA